MALKTPSQPAPPPDETARYPATSAQAVAARIGLLVCAAALIYATAMPASAVPSLFYSNNLEHFAAFYVAAVMAAAALPGRRLRHLALVLALFAAGLEGSRLLQHANPLLLEKWSADFGGVLAAYLPMGVERFRRMFRARPVNTP